MRASELINLTWGDVELESGRVHIRLGKGRKDRKAFLSVQTRSALTRYFEERDAPNSDDPIWSSTTRQRPLEQNGLNQMLRRLGKRAGIENTNPHTFRRTFAVMALEQGIDLYRLAQLMGHSHIEALRPYLTLVERHVREAHQKFGPLNGFSGDLDDLNL